MRGKLLRQTKSGGTLTAARYWYVLNGHGDVVALTDVTGTVVDSYSYDLWGRLASAVESVPQRLRYAGYWYDQELGWYWVSVRAYNPTLMRWLQPDPSQQDGVRTYLYVGDDPVDGTDPTGLSSGCNGATGQGIGRLFSAIGDFGCNIGQIKDTVLTGRANGTTSGIVTGISGLVFGPTLVAGGPSSASDYAYYVQADREQLRLDIETRNAGIVALALGAPSLVRGVVSFVVSLRGAKSVVEGPLVGLIRAGSALKTGDLRHGFPDIVDNFARYASHFKIPTLGPGGVQVGESDLYQLAGSWHGGEGIFEWIVTDGRVVHRVFIPGAKVTGIPNLWK